MKHAFHHTGKYCASAHAALFYASNWISALTVSFAVLLIIFTAVLLSNSLFAVLSALYPLPDGIYWILHIMQFLLLSPLAIGLLYFYTDLFRAAHGDGPINVPPSVIFSPYASGTSILHAWLQSLFSLPLLSLIPASFFPLYFAGSKLLDPNAFTVSTLLWLGSVIAFLAVLYLNARLLPALFLSAVYPERSFGHVIRMTWHTTKNTVLTGILLQLGLLAAAAVSVLLTAGILFFFYVLPFSVFTYIGYCHALSHRCDIL